MARTVEEMVVFMQSKGDENLKFDDVKVKLSERPDLHAFMLLDRLAPATDDGHPIGRRIILGADHDEVWISIPAEKIAAAATDEELTDLVRCGIMYDTEAESFLMLP